MSKSLGVFAFMLFMCLPLLAEDFAVTAHYDAKYDMSMQPYAAGPNAGIEFSITDKMTGVAVGSYHEWDKNSNLSSLGYRMEQSYTSFSAMVGIKYRIHQNQSGLENYLIILGGINRTNTIREITELDAEDSSKFKTYNSEWDENDPIGGIGLGVSFPINSRTAFDVQARHHLSTNSDNYNQLLVGINYKFF